MQDVIGIAANEHPVVVAAFVMLMERAQSSVADQRPILLWRPGDIAAFVVLMRLHAAHIPLQGDCRQDERIGSAENHDGGQTRDDPFPKLPVFPPFAEENRLRREFLLHVSASLLRELFFILRVYYRCCKIASHS